MKMISRILTHLSFGVFLLLIATPVFAGVGNLCPGGGKVTNVVENSTGRYVLCDDGKIYLLTGGGINGSKDAPSYSLVDGDWSVIQGTVITNIGNGNGGIFGSQYPTVTGGGTTPGGTTTTTTTSSGSMTACMQTCIDKWDGASNRQVRKRKACLESCPGYGGGSGGTVIVDGGGTTTTGNGGGTIIINGNGSNCDYTYNLEACIGTSGVYNANNSSGSGVDCPECSRREHWTSGVANIFGAIMPSLASFGSNAMWANATLGVGQANAEAQKVGFEQCRLQHQGYMDYLTTNSLPGLTPDSYQGLACNGYQMNQYSGYGGGYMGNGYGGFGNPYMQAGYSPGMMGGMMGPYGQGIGSPYGIGGGLYGNLGLGMGGMPGMGMGMGMGGPGMGMGMGMGGPGMGMGMGGPGMGMGMGMGMGGYPGGMGMGMGGYPGIGGGINIGGGLGMGNPYGSGYYGNPNGYGAGAGTMPWNTGGGGYFNGTGGYGNGQYGNGQYGNGQYGNGQYGQYGDPNQAYYSRMQSNMYGSQYQQQALQQNYYGAQQDMYGGMYNSGYGNAGYQPGNMGYGLTGGFNFGGGYGGGFY